MVNENICRQMKHHFKNHEKIPESYNIFSSNKVKIVQARSYADSIFKFKNIDQWYQLTLEYTNKNDNKTAYHVLERYFKEK